MKTYRDYEKELKERAFKSHDLALEADVVTIETALRLIQEACEQVVDRCAQQCFDKNIMVAGENEVWSIAKRHDILKLKSELK